MKTIKRFIPYTILFIITIIILSYILFNKKTVVGADSLFHFSNIYAWQTKISTGSLFTFKLLPVIGDGLLYGTPIFYASLPHFLTALLATVFQYFQISFSIIKAMKLYYIAVFFLSSVVTYKFILSFTKDKIVSIVGATFYLTLPFKLWDVYIRDGYTEIMTFLFIPMVFYGLHLLLNDNKKYFFYLIVGAVGVVLSHLITAIVTAFASIIYVIINYKKIDYKKVFFAILLTLGITAFFIFPLIEHYFLGNYLIFNSGTDNTDMILKSVITIKEMLIPNSIPGQHQFFIPITILITLLISIINYKRLKKNNIIKSQLIILLIFILIATVPFIIKLLPKSIYIIQYLFRIYIIPLFILSIISPLCLQLVKNEKLKICIAIALITMTTLISFLTIDKVYITSYNMYNSSISKNGMGWQKEYLPVNSNKNIGYIDSRSQDIIIKNGTGTISNISISFGKYEFDIIGDYEIEFPSYYYLGYRGKIKQGNNIKDIEVYENENGLLATKGNENGHVIIKYEGTIITKISYIISLTSLAIYIFLLIRKYRKKAIT